MVYTLHQIPKGEQISECEMSGSVESMGEMRLHNSRNQNT